MNERRRGQAMVEFIYVAPVLLLLILGALQFGLVYHAQISLNYAAFETARAGSLNNARMWAMKLAFARSLAPLYTTAYTNASCDGPADVDAIVAHGDDADLDDVKCARQRVKDMLAGGFARILLVNPSEESFLGDHAAVVDGVTYIPNDNLMYRSAAIDSTSSQSIQDANLIKVHVAICYELVVPVVNRIVNAFAAEGATGGSFRSSCPVEQDDYARGGRFGDTGSTGSSAGLGTGSGSISVDHYRFAIPIYAQAVMRMQSDPILDSFCAGQCP
jgi:hypothetical protein